MKKRKQIVILIISILIVFLVVSAVLLFDKKDSTEMNENNTVENEEIFNDLKNDLGKGTAGDVVSIDQGTDEDGNRTYTYNFIDGNSQTITIRKAEDGGGSGIGYIDNDNSDDDDDQDPQIPEDPKDLGTVFEKFLAMSSKQQSEFYKTFENPDEFYEWYEKAEAEYNALHPMIEIGDNEVIDFGN